MTNIGIIICGRYQNCGGGKCLRSMRKREGAFKIYEKDEDLTLVGYSYCGGCPGGNIEYVPKEMIDNGADIIHLATGMVVGYPPCPNLKHFKTFIEKNYNIKVIAGTHPIPMKYYKNHNALNTWGKDLKEKIAPNLFNEEKSIMKNYN